MSTSRFFDVLQDHLFWAMDASGGNLPVFTPLFGFSKISAPTIKTVTERFTDGTYNYPRTVVKGGDVDPVTFERAATLFDSDFYDWIMQAIDGKPLNKGVPSLNKLAGPVRRNILIFHFARINLSGGSRPDRDLSAYGDHRDHSETAFSATLSSIGAAFEGAVIGGLLSGSLGGVAAGGAAAFGSSVIGHAVGPFAFATWLPARAWMLHDCIPVNYVSGSGFDAANGSPSLMSLTVQPSYIDEYSFGIKP